MLQLNGYLGCNRCRNKGKTEKEKSKGGCKITFSVVGEPPRTNRETLKEACEAESGGHSKQSMKGLTWLFRCPQFDAIRGVAIAYNAHRVSGGYENPSRQTASSQA